MGKKEQEDITKGILAAGGRYAMIFWGITGFVVLVFILDVFVIHNMFWSFFIPLLIIVVIGRFYEKKGK